MSEPARNPKYNGRTVYTIETGALRPGDIILTRYVEGDDRQGRLQSAAICAGSGGQYSHALICSEPPTFVEAVGMGVKTISVQRCFAHDPSNIRVLRYPDAAVAAAAASWAQLEVGRTYSTRAALASVFPGKGAREIADRGVFCSALVAKVFSHAGAKAFQAQPPHKTTPATIEKLPGLIDITEQVLRPVLSPSNVEQLSALDGDRVRSPSERQTEISQRWARELTPQADTIAAAFPEATLTVDPTHFGFIHFIMEALDRQESVPNARRAEFLKRVGAFDARLAELSSSGELESVQAEILTLDTAENQQALAESFKRDPDIDVASMRSHLKTSEAQLAKRRKAIADFEAWGLDRSCALAVHVAAQTPILKHYELQITLMREILGRVAPGPG